MGSATEAQVATGRRVLIIEDDQLVAMQLNMALKMIGYEVVGEAGSAEMAEAKFRALTPDIVLLDIRLGNDDGIEVARQLLAVRRCPMIIVSAYTDPDLINRATAAGVFGYLVKPVDARSLPAQIEFARQRFDEHEQLLREKDELTRTLESRKLIEKAKGIFMKRLQLDEPEAHRRLQQESQKRRMSLPELAKRIIENEELFGSSPGRPV